MSGPLESLDIEGLDESLVCVDGVCAVPLPAQLGREIVGTREDPAPGADLGGISPRSSEGLREQGAGVVGEGDAADEGERLG
jgi:hypothetical protein